MNPVDKNNPEKQQPEILTNLDQGIDPTVVVSEADRSVVLTPDQTLVIDKEPQKIEVIPANRPRKVYRGMWGPMEIGAFGVSLLALLGLLALYLFFVVPSNNEVAQTKAQLDQLEQELISARSKYGDISNTQTKVDELATSASNFENLLPFATNGRTSIYQRLNGLIAGYGLVNTNGPNYAPLELNEGQNGNGNEGEDKDQERGRAKFRSIFPGVYVTMTLEGPYQNLRRFIREVETGNEFVIISSVELEPTEAKQKERDASLPPVATQQPVQSFSTGPGRGGFDPKTGRPIPMQMPQPQTVARPQGKTHGEVVSLRLEMAAYFRRPNFVPPVEQQ